MSFVPSKSSIVYVILQVWRNNITDSPSNTCIPILSCGNMVLYSKLNPEEHSEPFQALILSYLLVQVLFESKI